MIGITENGVTYYNFTLSAVNSYLREQFKNIELIISDDNFQYAVFRYNNCFCKIDVCAMYHIVLTYNESEKSKIQPIIDCIKKWDFCKSKNGFIVEWKMSNPIEHVLNHYAHLDHCTMICTGFHQKEYYIKHYDSCSIT